MKHQKELMKFPKGSTIRDVSAYIARECDRHKRVNDPRFRNDLLKLVKSEIQGETFFPPVGEDAMFFFTRIATSVARWEEEKFGRLPFGLGTFYYDLEAYLLRRRVRAVSRED